MGKLESAVFCKFDLFDLCGLKSAHLSYYFILRLDNCHVGAFYSEHMLTICVPLADKSLFILYCGPMDLSSHYQTSNKEEVC